MMLRIVLPLAALLAPFLFPLPLTFLLSLGAGFVFPLIPLIVGVALDLLYYTSALGFPLGIVLGVLGSCISYAVRAFVKARMMFPNA